MTPVDMRSPRLYALPMLLEDLVRKQEDDNDKGNNQKRAQYYVFDHDYLLVVKRLRFHCSRKATACATGVTTDSRERWWAAAHTVSSRVHAWTVMAVPRRPEATDRPGGAGAPGMAAPLGRSVFGANPGRTGATRDKQQ